MLGVGSIRQAAKVGRIGGIALAYFMVMSTVALAIGLVVGNILKPGSGLQLDDSVREAGQSAAGDEPEGAVEFLLGIIPDTLFSALTSGMVPQTLLVALLVGFALQAMAPPGRRCRAASSTCGASCSRSCT